MEIANFKGVVSWRECLDFQQEKRWLVIYGLQVKTLYTFEEAFDEYTSCVRHAAECDGYFD